ncbi:hypothetical protein [Peterkaempfera bronchialis]|uniref:hypothetical protein n=1 Tax=Peterkaempfera bronchialis TaxID=2126346 RepID=UPI0026904E4C|nr:hypothetical protein [Peterkaempfera bronchialis]
MARTDYFDDPDAPQANSIVPAVTAFVLNAEGEVLLERRSDNQPGVLRSPLGPEDRP